MRCLMRLIFEYFIDKIYVFKDKLIVDMFYSENHVEAGRTLPIKVFSTRIYIVYIRSMEEQGT